MLYGPPRWSAARRWRFDDDVVLAEEDGAVALVSLAHPPAQLGEIFVDVDHVTLGGRRSSLVITAIV